MKRVALFTAALFGLTTLGLTPAFAVDERVIDIVSVSWDGAVPLPSGVKDLETLVNTEVNASWKSFTTLNGDTQDRTISFVAGKVLSEPILLNSKMPCVGAASASFISSMRNEAYRRLGIADDSNRYLIITAPKAGCVWSGRAPLGNAESKSGTLVLHDTHESFVIVHELGHTFGLGHTNFLRCSDGKKDGAWGETCKAVEYGGVIDVMGNVRTNSPLNTYHQWRMGLLDDSQVKQVWQTQTLTLAPSDFANGIRAIYVRDGSAAYWVEYRRTLNGVGYKPGLVIFRIDPPPVSSVVSSNPEDASANEFKDSIGTDLWMLNLDSYRYLNGLVSGGSMTALSATTYSGNVTFTATATDTGAIVTVTKKADITPPPVPVLLPVSEWRYPGIEILKPGFADADTTITSFEVSLDGVVSELPVSERENWSPGYLNPFTAPITVYARDLPEGAYSFAIRATDVAGNKSEWSQAMKVNIDRGRPVVTSDFNLLAISGDQLSLSWTGAKDDGSGLCKTNLVDKEGLILQSSNAKIAPTVKVKSGTLLKATAQVFDCIGNGVSGDLSIANTVVPADKSSRTGKWSAAGSSYGVGALRCTGKCSASLSASGRFDVVVGTGAATVSTGTRTLANIPDSKVAKLRSGATVDVGGTKKVVRISGSNFVLIALASVTTTFTNVKDIDRQPSITDPSLTDAKQAVLAKYGFNADDFSQEWTVLPMNGGTTLVDPSLDLCNGTFASEKERVERRQVIATKPESAFIFLSTETVRYSSAAAAQSAQKELVRVMNQCMIDKGYTDSSATLMPYTFTPIKSLPSGLVADSSRVMVRAQIDSGVRARQLLGFYQFNGAMFTGLYVMTAGETPFTEAQVETWLNVAVTMATRLSGKSG
jgi:hypothetical protein